MVVVAAVPRGSRAWRVVRTGLAPLLLLRFFCSVGRAGRRRRTEEGGRGEDRVTGLQVR